MKIKNLAINQPLKMIEVSRHVEKPYFGAKKPANPDMVELRQIQMKVYTDGEIDKECEEITQSIDEYYIGKRKYRYDVDTLKTKDIYFKNHSYVIAYLLANKWMTLGTIKGWFDVVEGVSIFLPNSKDRKALRSAKQVIRRIENHKRSIDYSSVATMLFSQGRGIDKIETEQISGNVYSLKKVK